MEGGQGERLKTGEGEGEPGPGRKEQNQHQELLKGWEWVTNADPWPGELVRLMFLIGNIIDSPGETQERREWRRLEGEKKQLSQGRPAKAG